MKKENWVTLSKNSYEKSVRHERQQTKLSSTKHSPEVSRGLSTARTLARSHAHTHAVSQQAP